MQRLPLAVDDAGLDEVDDAVGAHLGLDAEVALVAQALQHCLGDAADAGLQRGAIGISEATFRATRRCVSVHGSAWSSSNGRDVSTTAERRLTWIKVSPCVRGIRWFTSAITVLPVARR